MKKDGWSRPAHVVKGYRTVTVHYQDSEGQEKSAMVNVLGRDRLHDVAAIALKDINLPPIPGRRDVEAKDGGEAVMTVGYSSDPPIGWPSTRVGILTTVSELPWLENLKAIETDASFDPGDSGGPILDLNGNVLGHSPGHRPRSRLSKDTGQAAGSWHKGGRSRMGATQAE